MPNEAARNCPICAKPQDTAFRPFCSRGCRDRDLNNWFDEDYRIAVRPADDEGDGPPSDDQGPV